MVSRVRVGSLHQNGWGEWIQLPVKYRQPISSKCNMNASPGCIQANGIVYCPINSSPMKSSSSTANRTSANSGRFMWNSKLSSNIGLAANTYARH